MSGLPNLARLVEQANRNGDVRTLDIRLDAYNALADAAPDLAALLPSCASSIVELLYYIGVCPDDGADLLQSRGAPYCVVEAARLLARLAGFDAQLGDRQGSQT